MASGKKKILFVENEQTFSLPLIERLNDLGYEGVIAAQPGEAVAMLSSTHPDLVIIDVGMHDMDGFSILETLRGNIDTMVAKTPVMIASNTGDLLEIDRALKMGIQDYFIKIGFDVEQVVAKIKKHIGEPELPVAPAPLAPAPAAPPQAAAASEVVATKLLIIEDDKFLRDLAAQKISKEGLIVTAAVDGEQGVQLAEKIIPDIILLDILLPGIDGYEVLKRVRANPALAKTRIAMLSNFGQREDIEKALTAGADQFLVKANYTLDEIVQEVKKIVATPRG